MRCLTNYRIG